MGTRSDEETEDSSNPHETSVWEYRDPEDIYDEIQQTYLSDDRPWVIGYSGGKDSTTVLQLVWKAVDQLPEDEQTKPIYVISSDTLVETPKIVNHITFSLEKVNEYAKREALPFDARKVYPDVEDSFWVNLLGKGYPAPNQMFRWCTERLKIDPADNFIMDKVSEHGEVVVILGARKSESATREQVMNLHSIEGTNLSRHSKFANAYVYTPIEDCTLYDLMNLIQYAVPKI